MKCFIHLVTPVESNQFFTINLEVVWPTTSYILKLYNEMCIVELFDKVQFNIPRE